jgi:heme/copper-type cytochrome/quinol oxidase subunit 2
LSLALFYFMLFMVIYSSALLLNSVFYNDVAVEVFMTLVSFAYIIAIISPGLLLFLDYDFISSLTNFNCYVLGYQWAWNYNVMFNTISYTFDQLVTPSSAFSSSLLSSSMPCATSVLHSIVQSVSGGCGFGSCMFMVYFCNCGLGSLHNLWTSTCSYCCYWLSMNLIVSMCANIDCGFGSQMIDFPIAANYPLQASFYMCLFSTYLLLPLYATISLFVNSFDVIHSYGYHCLGFKSDCIPGRVNHVSSLELHFPGHFLSYCYELCGIAHTSMLSAITVL